MSARLLRFQIQAKPGRKIAYVIILEKKHWQTSQISAAFIMSNRPNFLAYVCGLEAINLALASSLDHHLIFMKGQSLILAFSTSRELRNAVIPPGVVRVDWMWMNEHHP